MSTTERIEFETEQSRARVAELLDEMRARFSLGEMVDQLMDFAGDGTGREILNRLGEQVRSNPLSCLMIGGGFAWLLLSDRRQRSRDGNGGGQPVAGSGQYAASVSGAAQQVGETVSHAGEAMSGMYEGAREGVASMAGDAASLGQAAVETARQTAAHARDLSGRAASGVGYLLNEQPLVLAGMGLAVGAAIGAALPETEMEDRLMGEASDELKNRARDVAKEAKAFAADAIDATDEGTRDSSAEPNPPSFEAH